MQRKMQKFSEKLDKQNALVRQMDVEEEDLDSDSSSEEIEDEESKVNPLNSSNNVV